MEPKRKRKYRRPKLAVREPWDPSKPIESGRQELFAVLCSVGENGVPLSQSDAYRKAYPSSRKWKNETVQDAASALARHYRVFPRREWLKRQAASSRIADATERKEVLSEIVRGRLTQFGEMGAAGFVPNIGPESRNMAALEEISSRIQTGGEGDGSDDSVIVKVKLRDPIAAIKELNAMEGAYPDGKGASVVQNIIANGIIIETNIRRQGG